MTQYHFRVDIFLLLCLIQLAISSSANAQAVQGYVDLHSHLTAEESFGGGYLWGSINGPMEEAVQRCDGAFWYPSHATTIFRTGLFGRVGLIDPVADFGGGGGADAGWHLGKRRGYDERKCQYYLGFIKIPGTCPKKHFAHWPMWDAISHQQMWWGWLKQAHEGGLQVMVVSLLESNFLCINSALQSRRYGCDEMESIKRQAVFARNFANANSSWVGIAESPTQARTLIAQGKLALVLSVEATQLFPTGDFLAQLDELRALGVRSVQIAHHADSRFAGAAPIPKLMEGAKLVEFLWLLSFWYPLDITNIDEMICRNSNGIEGKCDGVAYLNERGLSAEGTTLVNAMMDRGMLLDVAHLSRMAFANTYTLAKTHGNYPLIYSHTHMWNTISPDEERHEKFLRDDEIHMITETGGMIGLRTGPESTNTFGIVDNICQGSSRSFAQSLIYAVNKGLNVGFGADLNGHIEQIKPRYRNSCSYDKWQLDSTNTTNELHRKGLAHVGLLPALMTDLQQVGTPPTYLNHLNQSAEKFLVIWEKSASLSVLPINLALSAHTYASSTHGSAAPDDWYSHIRINDGSVVTAFGGSNSWMNAANPLPQWVDLEWSAPITFSRVELFTTVGYAIRDFVIEYRTGTYPSYTWTILPVSFPTANTSTHLSYTFPSITSSAVRVLCKSGPLVQPDKCRVNELEVYQY